MCLLNSLFVILCQSEVVVPEIIHTHPGGWESRSPKIEKESLRSGAHFSKAPKTFWARKAIFNFPVSKNWEVCKPETSCMKGNSVDIKNMWIKGLHNYKVWDFGIALQVWKSFGTVEKWARGQNTKYPYLHIPWAASWNSEGKGFLWSEFRGHGGGGRGILKGTDRSVKAQTNWWNCWLPQKARYKTSIDRPCTWVVHWAPEAFKLNTNADPPCSFTCIRDTYS